MLSAVVQHITLHTYFQRSPASADPTNFSAMVVVVVMVVVAGELGGRAAAACLIEVCLRTHIAFASRLSGEHKLYIIACATITPRCGNG